MHDIGKPFINVEVWSLAGVKVHEGEWCALSKVHEVVSVVRDTPWCKEKEPYASIKLVHRGSDASAPHNDIPLSEQDEIHLLLNGNSSGNTLQVTALINALSPDLTCLKQLFMIAGCSPTYARDSSYNLICNDCPDVDALLRIVFRRAVPGSIEERTVAINAWCKYYSVLFPHENACGNTQFIERALEAALISRGY
jgi:hypothetical protein